MTVRVLTDFHHHALAESLLILFEDRGILGPTEVYFPVGMEWFDRGYWNFERAWHGDAVARQYLVGVWPDREPNEAGIVLRQDPRHPGRIQKGITLDAARSQRWDIVLSSLPHNYEGYHRLAGETGARFGIQVGNEAQDIRWDLADFVLSSSTQPDRADTATPYVSASGKPAVIYHQEFDLRVFRHEWPPSTSAIGSFIQCFAENTAYYEEFRRFTREEPGFDWRVYGSYGSAPKDELEAGNIDPVPDIADEMRAMRIIWHQKGWGDGFGHVVHNAFAVGRPVVGRARYYHGRLAGPLWADGVTSWDIDAHPRQETRDMLRRLISDDDLHRRMSEAAVARFFEVVDFDADAFAVKQVLEAVL